MAKKYAEGLFRVGEKDGNYLQYKKELEDFLSLINKSEPLYRTIMLPIFDLKVRKDVLLDVGRYANLSTTVTNLLVLLLENNRVKLLPSIVEEYSRLVDEKENVLRGKLYSPYPLEPELVKEIETVLSEKFKKKVVLTIIEDKSLLAGIKLSLNGTVIDGTLRKQLEIIKENLLKE